MKAMVIEAFGGSEQLKLVDLPTPEPEDDEVLIELAYTSVNPVDWKIREGRLKDRLPYEFPIILGWDAAGRVSAIGKAVAHFRVGDEVYAYCRKPIVQYGTYAEYVTMNEAAVAPKPENLSFPQAASIPLTGLTAWQALFDFADLRFGQTVLIHAGAGGVGGLAIQFAKHAGAKVYTTAGRPNHNYVKQLGADIAIDYNTENVSDAVKAAAPEGIDVLFDIVGGTTLAEGYRLVKPGGTVVSIVEPPDEAVAKENNLKAGYVFVEPNGQELREMGRLIEAGAVRAPVIEEMQLEEAAAALDKSQMGHVKGKIVLKIR